MPVRWWFRRTHKLGVCCHCGREITYAQLTGGEVVTVVAAAYDRLRAHRECNFYRPGAIEWPNKDQSAG